MHPRLNTSKKWTAMPAELTQQIKDVFTEGFGQAVANGEILVEGRFYTKELMLRVGYLEKGRMAPANFEVSLDFDSAKQNAMGQIQFAMDCAASMMEDYLKNEEDGLADFPRKWEAFDIAGRQVFLKISTENKTIEAEANKILGEATEPEEGLVIGDDEDSEVARKQVYAMLGLDEHGKHVHGPGCNHDEAAHDEEEDDGHGHGGKGHKHGPGCKH